MNDAHPKPRVRVARARSRDGANHPEVLPTWRSVLRCQLSGLAADMLATSWLTAADMPKLKGPSQPTEKRTTLVGNHGDSSQ